MDVAVTINKLRVKFLKQCREKDQFSRVIRPYGERTEHTLDLFVDENGHSLLQRMESPPIAESLMRYGRSGSNILNTATNSRLFPASQNNTMVSLVEEEEMNNKSRDSDSDKDVRPAYKSSVSTDRTKSLAPQKVQRRGSDLSLQSTATRSSDKLEKRKKSGLRLSRLFRSSSVSSKNGNGKNKFMTGRSRAGSLKKPALNLYDHFLYTREGLNDLEDEDDDDDDKYEYDKGAVLNFFGKDKRNDSSSSSLALDEKVKSTTKKTNFLDNFPLNPHNILQSSDTVDSAESDKKNKDGTKKGKNSTEKEAIQDASSYIESYLNQPDLQPIEHVHGGLTEHSSVAKTSREASIGTNRNILDSVSHATASDDAILVDDDASSYGKSLLDSDFSADDFDSSRLQSSEMSSMTFDSHEIPSNSIPRSRALTISNSGDDDSALDTELDRATKLLYLASKNPKQSFSQSVPRDQTGITKKFNLSQPELRSLNETRHRKSTSSLLESSHFKLSKPQGRHKRTTSLVITHDPQENCEKKSSEAELLIEKSDTFIHTPSAQQSALSAMFNKSRPTTINPLAYFCTASALKEISSNTLSLDVYIQNSKTYKRKPFTIRVKKTATVFEVLGYCLYCYSTDFKPSNTDGELPAKELVNPNYFTLKIVDEDGEPFEDNFGVLDRLQKIDKVFDNEVVICRVSSEEQFLKNEKVTPLPNPVSDAVSNSNSEVDKSYDSSSSHINQLSYYKSIIPADNSKRPSSGSNFVNIKVFLYPNLNPQYNFTNIRIPVSAKINEILVTYCKMKNLDPTEYVLKVDKKNLILDLNDYVTSLDGNYDLQVLKQKDARNNNFERLKNTAKQPALPTIQSTDLTPLTLTIDDNKLDRTLQEEGEESEKEEQTASKSGVSKALFGISKQGQMNSTASGFFKLKNSSRSSLNSGHKSPKINKPPKLADNLTRNSGYKDLFSGSYYKYKVWRRQQMSFINKHERTLVIDGDYVYISGPDGDFNWAHDNVKTKSFHLSQITLVKRSKRVPEYFKIFVHRPDRERRYYFEAVSPEECLEIISRLQNLIRVYRMNQK